LITKLDGLIEFYIKFELKYNYCENILIDKLYSSQNVKIRSSEFIRAGIRGAVELEHFMQGTIPENSC